MPLGGFATSRSPLAAVAARGAVDNVNVSMSDRVNVILKCRRFFLCSLLLCITDTLSVAIEDFDTDHFYSPLRGNMGSYVLE